MHESVLSDSDGVTRTLMFEQVNCALLCATPEPRVTVTRANV